jgi:hypothetical protein
MSTRRCLSAYFVSTYDDVFEAFSIRPVMDSVETAKFRFSPAEYLNEITPITRPKLSNNGPPLLPEETGAVV